MRCRAASWSCCSLGFGFRAGLLLGLDLEGLHRLRHVTHFVAPAETGQDDLEIAFGEFAHSGAKTDDRLRNRTPDQPCEQHAENEASDRNREDQVFRRNNHIYRFMLDLRFLGDAGLLDAFGSGGDRLGLLRHLAIGEILDLVGVLGRLVVSVGIFFDIAVGVGEHLASLVAGDPRTERGHRRL